MKMQNKRIFISFLGIGQFDKEKRRYDYQPVIYKFNENQSKENKFVQIAELELLDKKFDKIILLATEKSKKLHYDNLRQSLTGLGYTEEKISLINIGKRDELISVEKHKEWFEKLLDEIYENSILTIDITHSFRIVPIILATAIHFLKIVKNIKIEHVLYGAFDLVDINEKIKPIIDVKDFFIITDWASAISDFVNFLDISNIVKLSKKNENLQIYNIENDEIFEEVNLRIKSADMVSLSKKVSELLDYIGNLKANSVISKILSEMIKEKYKSLLEKEDLHYNKKFFDFQLNFIKVLIEHGLLMQAYTVMRETIGSIGLIGYEKLKNKKINIYSSKGRKRRSYAEVFIKMLQYKEEKWIFNGDEKEQNEKLIPFYNKLKSYGIIDELKKFLKDLIDIRNAFDHAWTAKKFDKEIVNKSKEHYENLKEIIEKLKQNNII